MSANNPSYPVFEKPDQALAATDVFYETQEGFQYSEDMVTSWLSQFVKIPKIGRVLDLCCGDGIWSKGFEILNSALDLYGIDISHGGIAKAMKLLGTDSEHFVVGDAEAELPFQDDYFHLIFARGPGLYNQHNMDRPSTIEIIEHWHTKLVSGGLFYSIFASNPQKIGTYTEMENAKLPYNRCPRKSDSVDFKGGKFHHSIQSFLAPFWKASNVAIVRYSFINNMHILVTKKNI